MFSHLTLFLLIKHRKTFRWAFLTTMETRKRNDLIKMLTFLFQIHLTQSPLSHDILKIVISYIGNSLFFSLYSSLSLFCFCAFSLDFFPHFVFSFSITHSVRWTNKFVLNYHLSFSSFYLSLDLKNLVLQSFKLEEIGIGWLCSTSHKISKTSSLKNQH